MKTTAVRALIELAKQGADRDLWLAAQAAELELVDHVEPALAKVPKLEDKISDLEDELRHATGTD